jgi:hypothetical protein
MSSKQADLYELLNIMKIEDRITVWFFALSGLTVNKSKKPWTLKNPMSRSWTYMSMMMKKM